MTSVLRLRAWRLFVAMACRRARLQAARNCDPFEQARKLHLAGFHAPAAVMVRIGIEQVIREMLPLSQTWKGRKSEPMLNACLHLARIGVIDKRTRNRVVSLIMKANGAAHGHFTGGRLRSAYLLASGVDLHRTLTALYLEAKGGER